MFPDGVIQMIGAAAGAEECRGSYPAAGAGHQEVVVGHPVAAVVALVVLAAVALVVVAQAAVGRKITKIHIAATLCFVLDYFCPHINILI